MTCIALSRNEFNEIWIGTQFRVYKYKSLRQIDDIFNNEFSEHDATEIETNETTISNYNDFLKYLLKKTFKQ